MFLVSKQTTKKTQMVGQEGGCNYFCFINLCFAKCEKLWFFWGAFFEQILGDVQKHIKIGIPAHF